MKHAGEMGVRWRVVHADFHEDGSDIPVMPSCYLDSIGGCSINIINGLGGFYKYAIETHQIVRSALVVANIWPYIMPH
jgi:hypothetical protein